MQINIDTVKRGYCESVARGDATETMLEGDDPSSRVATTIAKDAQGWDADLIVLRTHDRRGLNRTLLGSAETLVRMAPAPVLLMQARPRA